MRDAIESGLPEGKVPMTKDELKDLVEILIGLNNQISDCEDRLIRLRNKRAEMQSDLAHYHLKIVDVDGQDYLIHSDGSLIEVEYYDRRI